MIREKSCGAIVYTNSYGERLYLVEQMHEGHWGVPKGHVEANETETETALREIKEEVGLNVTIDTRFREIDTYSPKAGIIKDVVYFVAYSESTRTTMQASEVKDVRWVKFEEAMELISFPSMQKIFLMAEDYLSRN